jgi:hypothetical protein
MPSVEAGIDALIAVAIVSLLAIRRRDRIDGTVEPAAVSVATGVILGIVTAMVGIAIIVVAVGSLG